MSNKKYVKLKTLFHIIIIEGNTQYQFGIVYNLFNFQLTS